MTENELSQIRFLMIELEQLKKYQKEVEFGIENYENTAQTKLKHAPVRVRCDSLSALDDMLDSLTNIKALIDHNLRKIQRERLKIEKFISEIPDSDLRLIFRLKHINGLSNEAIAEELGYEESAIRKKRSRYLAKIS